MEKIPEAILNRLVSAMNEHGVVEGTAVAMVRPSDLDVVVTHLRSRETEAPAAPVTREELKAFCRSRNRLSTNAEAENFADCVMDFLSSRSAPTVAEAPGLTALEALRDRLRAQAQEDFSRGYMNAAKSLSDQAHGVQKAIDRLTAPTTAPAPPQPTHSNNPFDIDYIPDDKIETAAPPQPDITRRLFETLTGVLIEATAFARNHNLDRQHALSVQLRLAFSEFPELVERVKQ